MQKNTASMLSASYAKTMLLIRCQVNFCKVHSMEKVKHKALHTLSIAVMTYEYFMKKGYTNKTTPMRPRYMKRGKITPLLLHNTLKINKYCFLVWIWSYDLISKHLGLLHREHNRFLFEEWIWIQIPTLLKLYNQRNCHKMCLKKKNLLYLKKYFFFSARLILYNIYY